MKSTRLITSGQLAELAACDGSLAFLAMVQGAIFATVVTALVLRAPWGPSLVLTVVLAGTVWPQLRLWRRRAALVEALPQVEVTHIDGEPYDAEEGACVH